MSKNINTPFTSSENLLANIFMKPLVGKKFLALKSKLGMINIYTIA